MAKLSIRLHRRPVFAQETPSWSLAATAICRNVSGSDFGGDLMGNLILILLLFLFFVFFYLLMSQFDRILDRLREWILRIEQQRPDPDRKIPDENDSFD